MKEGELKIKLNYNNEKTIFMPNEILTDLLNNNSIKNGMHIAFCYSYYYLITYLYRYAKYGIYRYQTNDLKEILGYAADYKEVNYLIKKNGILDAMGYTYSSTDFPVVAETELIKGKVIDIVFTMYSEMKELYQEESLRNYKIKVPVKALHRTNEDYKEGYLNGTFYEIENTHGIDPMIFMKCMENDELGTVGFYLYGYLKRNCDLYKGNYDISLNHMELETRIPERTLKKYLMNLNKYNFISVDRQEYVIGLPKEKRKSNTYKVNEYEDILDEPQEIKKGMLWQYVDGKIIPYTNKNPKG